MLTVNLGLRFVYIGVPFDAQGLWRTLDLPGATEIVEGRGLGFTRAEVSYILLGELALLTLLALPLGCAIGYGLAALIASSFDSEVYRIPLVVEPATYGYAVLVVVAASALSALAVRRRIDRLDLVAVLKTRE